MVIQSEAFTRGRSAENKIPGQERKRRLFRNITTNLLCY